MTIIEVKTSANANQVANAYRALGYTAKININHAAFINSPVRTDNLFIVTVTKN